MNRQIQALIVFAMAVGSSIMLTSYARSQSIHQGDPVNPLEDDIVQRVSPVGYTSPDQNWPIVKREFSSYYDENSGLTIEYETVWRREFPQPDTLAREMRDCSQFQPLSGDETGIQKDFPDCSSEGNQSVSRTVRAKKSTTDYLEMRHKSYATQYCPDSVGCGYFTTFFDMYRTEAS